MMAHTRLHNARGAILIGLPFTRSFVVALFFIATAYHKHPFSNGVVHLCYLHDGARVGRMAAEHIYADLLTTNVLKGAE